jgi:hypothetical protein
MKKITISLIVVLFAAASLAQAQKDVTQFLGIPVDGYKSEMIRKLKDKGFTSNLYDKDVLEGEFNGTNVEIHIVTNNNKVCRILVSDVYKRSEVDIRIRFNTLCRQFRDNKKYMSLSQSDYTIPGDEDIAHEMSVNNKRYEAVFYQLPAEGVDTAALRAALLSKFTKEQLSNPAERERLIEDMFSYAWDMYTKKTVWFMIDKYYGKYYINMYYDNEYNKANGEDL